MKKASDEQLNGGWLPEFANQKSIIADLLFCRFERTYKYPQ
jgi:hypothetical protein